MLLICVAFLLFIIIVAVFSVFCLVSQSIGYDREINDSEQEKFIRQCRKVHISKKLKGEKNEISKQD